MVTVHAIPRARVYTVQQLVLCVTTKYRQAGAVERYHVHTYVRVCTYCVYTLYLYRVYTQYVYCVYIRTYCTYVCNSTYVYVRTVYIPCLTCMHC